MQNLTPLIKNTPLKKGTGQNSPRAYIAIYLSRKTNVSVGLSLSTSQLERTWYKEINQRSHFLFVLCHSGFFSWRENYGRCSGEQKTTVAENYSPTSPSASCGRCGLGSAPYSCGYANSSSCPIWHITWARGDYPWRIWITWMYTTGAICGR